MTRFSQLVSLITVFFCVDNSYKEKKDLSKKITKSQDYNRRLFSFFCLKAMAISWVFHSLLLAHIMFVLRRLQALSNRPLMVFTIHRVVLDVRDAHSVLHGYHVHDARGVHGPHTVHGVHGVHHVRYVYDAHDAHDARDVHDAHGAVHGVLHDDGWKIVLIYMQVIQLIICKTDVK